jgi:hypothetical protein
VELDARALAALSEKKLDIALQLRNANFFAFTETGFDAAIGNPPFVRLRHLTDDEQKLASQSAKESLGQEMDPSGSTWMPFVLHAARCLSKGGAFAFVLPLDVTFVRYARPFWRQLAGSFGALRLIRVRERLFPDLSQDVVLLMGEQAGGCTQEVRFEAYASFDDVVAERAEVQSDLSVDRILRGERAFLWALLPPQLQELLRVELAALLEPASNVCRFRIGYVSGDRDYFHPSREMIHSFALGRDHLHPTIASARSLRSTGLYTSGIPSERAEVLFNPVKDRLGPGERQYIDIGELIQVSHGYKCRTREPWYNVPYVTPPDIILSVFSDRPLVAINDANCAVSNSFLSGSLLRIDAPTFVSRWYNSLTLLECELNVHALGGGVFVLVPREAASVRLMNTLSSSSRLLRRIDSAMRQRRIAAAYEAGDDHLLSAAPVLTRSHLELIRDGVALLRSWRLPLASNSNISSEEVDEQFAFLET